MSAETKILTDGQIDEALESIGPDWWDVSPGSDRLYARAIEQAVLQSPEIQALRKDAEQLNWLLNNLRDFHAILFDGATPLLYRGRHLKSADALRSEINAAMEKQP